MEEVQDSISETEYSERLGARTVSNKEKGPSSGFKKIRMGERLTYKVERFLEPTIRKKERTVVYILCRSLKLCKLKVTMKMSMKVLAQEKR